MEVVQFRDQARYQLAAAVAAPLGARLDEAARQVSVPPALAALLRRIDAGDAALLPQRGSTGDTWLIVGATERDLAAAFSRVSRFVVPTYAEHDSGVYTTNPLEPNNALEGLVAQVFPAGRSALVSPPQHFNAMLNRLALWAELEARRPQQHTEPEPSYAVFYARLSSALSAADWREAERIIGDMRHHGLASADNLVFLEVQLLAQQQRWVDIWHRSDYPSIARLRAPQEVRSALLAALHQAVLLEPEQRADWDAAGAALRDVRPRVASLLEGLPDSAFGPAARARAHAAALAGDQATFAALRGLPLDEETRQIVDALASRLPAPIVSNVSPPASPHQRIRAALIDGDYLAAADAADMLVDAIEHAVAFIQIAYLAEDTALAERAMLQFWSLPDDAQSVLGADRSNSAKIASLTAAVSTPATSGDDAPHDWSTWLALAASSGQDSRLAETLERVDADTATQLWSSEEIQTLADHLNQVTISGDIARPTLRDAVRRLRNRFIQDSEFPRESAAYTELYESLYTATLEQREVNAATTMALLRLAEARLRQTPAAQATITGHLTSWLNEPMPVLESAAQETLDLLAAYGAQGPALAPWFRSWAEAAIGAPGNPDRASIEGWLALGEWAQPGEDLLRRIRARLDASGATTDDLVASLPSGFQVSIFTLRPESAARVATLLQRRNPGLRIELCDDTVLTERAKNLAQVSDMAVVVTTCITHALTYGIGPHLRAPVYPQSSGSTSIMRAIEERLVRM